MNDLVMHTLFRNRYMYQFRNEKVNVYIIVEYAGLDNKPIITFIHRLRFGSNIMPIPVWLSREKAECCCRNFVKNSNCRVIEISHTELSEIINQQRYDSSYPKFWTYHLDFQIDQEEIENFLNQSK